MLPVILPRRGVGALGIPISDPRVHPAERITFVRRLKRGVCVIYSFDNNACLNTESYDFETNDVSLFLITS